MEIKIPYNPGLGLGELVNMKTFKTVTTQNKCFSPSDIKQVREFTANFAFIENLEDVCSILSVPPEYVLKVKAKITPDKVVEACLQNLGRPNSFTLVFKAKYTERKEEKSSRKSSKTTNQISDPKLREQSVDREPATHWINSMTLGQDLIIVVTVTDKVEGKSSKLRKKLTKECFGSSADCLDGTKRKNLKEKAPTFNNFFSENFVDCFYFSFTQLKTYPIEWSDVINLLENFCDQCTLWSKSTEEKNCKVNPCDRIAVHVTSSSKKEVEQRNFLKDFNKNTNNAASSCLSSFGRSEQNAATQQTENSLVDEVGRDFVMLGSSRPTEVYIVEFTLQPLKTDLKLQKADKEQNLKLYYIILEKLLHYQMAEDLLKDFMAKVEHDECYVTEFQRHESEQIKTFNNKVTEKIINLTAAIDFTKPLSESSVERVCTKSKLEDVLEPIKNLTVKLPPGEELDFLLIGKTGHGKSSTGNSILLRKQFKSSSDTDSETLNCEIGYAKIDDRDLRIVDTPGICDTRLSKAEYLAKAFAIFSNIIAASPKGFHALIFVFKFPVRYTDEEKYCIKMLKGILGQNIIKDHAICVFTGGDQFMNQMIIEKRNWSFKQWCHKQTGQMGELFEECEYRCVQLDNCTNDNTIKKAQLVQLVALVDSKLNSTPYTNASFDLASKERERLCADMKLETDMFRDVQLLLDSVNKMQSSSTSLEEKHLNLVTIDHLSKTLTEIAVKSENVSLKSILDSTSKLTENIKNSEDEYQIKLNDAQKAIKEFEHRNTDLAVCLKEKDEQLRQKDEEINHQIVEAAKRTKISKNIQEIMESVRTANEKELTSLNQKLSQMKKDTSFVADDYIRSSFKLAESSINYAKRRESKKTKEMHEKKRREEENRELKRSGQLRYEESLERERRENKKRDQERREQEKVENEKREQERREQEKIENERREQERREQERLENERREQERREQERLENEKREKRRHEDTLKITTNIVGIIESARKATPQELLQLEADLNKEKNAAEKIYKDGFEEIFKKAEEVFKTITQQHENIKKKAETCYPNIKSSATKINEIESKTTGEVAISVNTQVQSSGKGCFPASSTVILISGKLVNMGVLQVGDMVLVVTEDNQVKYDTVYMFGHSENNVFAEFLALKTSSRKVLLTSDHLVFVMREDKKVTLAARDVQVGDCLLVSTSDCLQPEQVEAITLEQEFGLFAPFTNSGTILVNGALMSCYVDVLPHHTCHTCLWPMRQLFKVSHRALAFINGSPTQHPIPAWARAFLKLQDLTRTMK